jgi:hypothetical protein
MQRDRRTDVAVQFLAVARSPAVSGADDDAPLIRIIDSGVTTIPLLRI